MTETEPSSISGALRPAFHLLPHPEAVVLGTQVRFTILTSRLLRLEYSPQGYFEDRPSQAFWRRRFAKPEFEVHHTADSLRIETPYLHLDYQISPRGFAQSTLSVLVKETGAVWRYGDWPRRAGNLGGTARTLDESSGRVHLEPGLMARSGWSLINDSDQLVFNDDGWLAVRSHPENLDLYFFGYGHDYIACLRDYSHLAGRTPMIPRWILGNWWSRYWAYTADELLGVVDEFKAHDVPLSICIVDMDWHLTETGNAGSGWTGYTWNRVLFPDPPGFIEALHARGVRTALNLHPAEGIWPHEEQFPAFAASMGLDTQECDSIPFNCVDRHFMQAYFDLLHAPNEAQGVDFWWLDWQQGTHTQLAGLDPLWWLNHLHYYHMGRDGRKRPFIFSRWGGLGNHRYPIGFSGDTVVDWASLDFQPYFTATAANVNYGWWSHDIGGHMLGIEDDELYARWVQFGVFSPIFRLHSTNNAYHERRPWQRGNAAQIAVDAMRLRHALIPYLYAMAWRNHRHDLPLVTPMYYAHPEQEDAYLCPGQYWFGSELVVAPFTQPAEASTRLARKTVWLPAGQWFDFFTGEHFSAGWHTRHGRLQEIPVYAKAGAIIPLDARTGWGPVKTPLALHIHVFSGADGRFDLYEDDGETNDYLDEAYALTAFSLHWSPNQFTFKIAPASGRANLLPEERPCHLIFHALRQPDVLQVACNGIEQAPNVVYDPEAETLTLLLTLRASDDWRFTAQVQAGELLSRRDWQIATLRKYLTAFRLHTAVKAEIEHRWPDLLSGSFDLRSFSALTGEQADALAGLLALSRAKAQGLL